MKSFISRYSLSFLTATLLSCGGPENPSGTLLFYHDGIPGLHLHQLNCSSVQYGEDPLINEIDELIESSRNLIGAYSVLSGIQLATREGVELNSPEVPLRASSLLLREDLKRLKEMRWRIFQSEETDREQAFVALSARVEQVIELETSEVEQFFNQVNLLSLRMQRWKNSVCQQDQYAKRAEFDVRPFLRLKNETQILSQKFKDAIKLCESFHSKSRCLSEWHIYKRNRQEDIFVNAYQKRFDTDKYQTLFKLRATAPKFSCQKLGKKQVLEIKIAHNDFLKNYFPSREVAELKAVARYWTSENFELSFVLVDPEKGDERTLVLKQVERGLSHVNSETPFSIYLQAFYPQDQRVKLLAHEIGHTLGFPDCYVEFYNRQSGELTYYELQRTEGNLMCSLEYGRQIPKAYLVQLIERSCSEK